MWRHCCQRLAVRRPVTRTLVLEEGLSRQQRQQPWQQSWQKSSQHDFFTTAPRATTLDAVSSSTTTTRTAESNISSNSSDNNLSSWTNEELVDTSTIPGWHLIHSPPAKRQTQRGSLVGRVVGAGKMQKTVTVAVDRYRIVPKLSKRVRRTQKFLVHDEDEVSRLNDTVRIAPCHRISKRKHFLLREIVRPAGDL